MERKEITEIRQLLAGLKREESTFAGLFPFTSKFLSSGQTLDKIAATLEEGFKDLDRRETSDRGLQESASRATQEVSQAQATLQRLREQIQEIKPRLKEAEREKVEIANREMAVERREQRVTKREEKLKQAAELMKN